jgi:hypothetical protein
VIDLRRAGSAYENREKANTFIAQGLALGDRHLVDQDLAAGRLVDVIPSDTRRGGYYLIAPQGHWRELSRMTLRGWLRTILQDRGMTDALNATMLANS